MSAKLLEDDFYYGEPFFATGLEEHEDAYVTDGIDSYEAEQQEAFLLQEIENAYTLLQRKESFEVLLARMKVFYTSSLFFLESHDSLLTEFGVQRTDATFFSMIPLLARVSESANYNCRSKLNTYPRMAEYLKTLFIGTHKECFYAIMLNRDGYLRNTFLIQAGSEDSTLFNLLDVITIAMRCKAKAVVFCHNHPHGTLKPSDDDIACTLRSLSVTKAMGVPLLDHIIISEEKSYSFREGGILPANLWIEQSPGSKLMRGWLDHDVLELPLCR